ncbi:hypothetical protein TI03_05745, partial [Achromatium sp. WMS1]
VLIADSVTSSKHQPIDKPVDKPVDMAVKPAIKKCDLSHLRRSTAQRVMPYVVMALMYLVLL